MFDDTKPADLSDGELAYEIKRYRSAALRGSGYTSRRAEELERELRHRAGIVSEYGAPLKFADPERPKRPWWRFW